MTFLRVKRAEYRRCPWFNPHAADLIDSLLVVDPEKRLGAGGDYDALRSHAFFGAGWDTEAESVETAVDFAGLIEGGGLERAGASNIAGRVVVQRLTVDDCKRSEVATGMAQLIRFRAQQQHGAEQIAM